MILPAVRGSTTVNVSFSVELTSGSLAQLQSANVTVNETLIAQMILSDPITNTTVGLQAISQPVAAVVSDAVFVSSEVCEHAISYLNGTTCLNCSVCPALTIQACSASADAVCDTQCAAGSILVGGQCTLCAPGKYAAARGSSACSLCSPSYFASAAGRSACTACAAGTTSLWGFSTCVKVKNPPLKRAAHIYVEGRKLSARTCSSNIYI
jgi:hypothetical protein